MPVFDPLSRYRAENTAYQAIDLTAGAAGVVSITDLSSVNNGSVAINLGSNVFRFYGASFSGASQLFVSENGLISFGGAESSWSNNSLFGYEAYRIAPLWDDWVTDRNAPVDDLVLYQFRDLNTDGIADQLVIEWNNVYNYNTPEGDGATFQAILSLNTGASNGDIVFNYVDLSIDGDSGDGNFNNGGSATIGIRSGQPAFCTSAGSLSRAELRTQIRIRAFVSSPGCSPPPMSAIADSGTLPRSNSLFHCTMSGIVGTTITTRRSGSF